MYQDSVLLTHAPPLGWVSFPRKTWVSFNYKSTSAKLKGNTLTVTWSRSANATGYDIVMGKAARKVNGEMRPVDYGKAVKKITNGDTVTATFRNIPSGTYYVGLHAWNRTSETGVKVFSPWSNGRKVVVK